MTAAELDPVFIAVARMSTPRLISSVSRPESTNNGRVVVKFSMLCAFGAGRPSATGGVHWTADLNFPSIVDPCVWIASTLSFASSVLNTVYDIGSGP